MLRNKWTWRDCGWALACWLLSGLLAVGPETARGVEATPSLRIETGSHVAPIRAAGMDRDGRYAVTASEDKTARIWDAASGSLLAVFRPPSGAGNDGKLYAVAMAPDGALVAAAGWSASNDLYLVRRHDGQIIHRITALPDVVTHLSFSPDGRILLSDRLKPEAERLGISGQERISTLIEGHQAYLAWHRARVFGASDA